MLGASQQARLNSIFSTFAAYMFDITESQGIVSSPNAPQGITTAKGPIILSCKEFDSLLNKMLSFHLLGHWLWRIQTTSW